MGANRFLKLGGFEWDSREARTFFLSPPPFISKPPNFKGLGYYLGGLQISKPRKIEGDCILTGGAFKF